jgi:hypothetical protein
MSKRKKHILAVKGEWLEESPLPLSPCKRETRAQFTNSIPMEYGEDESLFGHLHPKQPEPDIQAAGEYDLVDALAVAIAQIRLSDPTRRRLCVPACPVPLQCSSNLKKQLLYSILKACHCRLLLTNIDYY